MAATVGKYVLKGLDDAAEWISNIKFGKNADLATENDRVLVMDLDGLQRQLSYSRRGQEQLIEPGGIIGGSTDAAKSQKYANFVEFAESTDQPIHMPVVRADKEGMLYLEDGSVTLAAMRDAGLTEIPVMVNKADTRDIPGHMLSTEGMYALSSKDIPVTAPAKYKPKTLTPQQQKQFNDQVEAGRPAHTAKSIVLGEMPMDQASREARRIEQGILNRGYHRGSPDIKNIEPGQDGFFMAEDPLVSASYPGRGGPTSTYELRYDDSNMLGMNAFGRKWNQLAEDRNLDDVIINDFPVYTPDGQELKLHSEMGSGVPYTGTSVEDTNDLAMLARGMNASGVMIDNVHDLGGNFQGTKNVFGEMNKNLLPSHKNIFDARWADFLQEYDREGGTNIVSATGRGIRSAIGAAYDKRNKALPNILGGGTAVAIGLGASDSEAGIPDAAAKAVNKAINVRVDKKAGIDYADEILSGNKTFETRNTDSLRPYVGQRVGIARTGAGEAKALGSAEIGEPIVVDEATFRTMQNQHLVPPGTDFDIAPGGTKYLYPVSNPERFDTPKDVGKGIVARKILGGGAATAFGLGASDSSQAAVERLNAIMEGRMSPTNRSRSAQAQKTITGEFPVTPTQEVVYRTMSDNFDPNPDVGSITGVPMNPVSQAAGNVGFALQGFGDRAAAAGPLGWMVGTAIKDLGEISQRAAYGESKATDPAMAVLDILALTPGAYMSQGMRTAMSDKDVGSMIFRELLK